MDTTDEEISFDEQGVCNHCTGYFERAKVDLKLDAAGQEELTKLVTDIRDAGRGRPYDCVIGVSGGVDSTFVALTLKRLGLRPLAVHLDNGWDSELAVSNIEQAMKRLKIDLVTHVLDWEEFKDLQLAFLEASVPDAEIPTDHAIITVLYHAAIQHGIKYVIGGSNLVTEGIMPPSWVYGVGDWRYIRAVHKQFGRRKLRRFPHHSFLDWAFRYPLVHRLKMIRVLNYVQYERRQVLEALDRELGWRSYGGKHYESIYTRFFQGYILPMKFGIDKRIAHLSTLICSGQITRENALSTLEGNEYTAPEQAADREYVLKKLDLTDAGFERIMSLPVRSSTEFPTSRNSFRRIIRVVRFGKSLGLLPNRPLSVGV